MTYDTDFLTASFVILLLVGHHFVNSRKLHDRNGRIFCLFMLLGMLDVLFDILTTVMIENRAPGLAGMTLLSLTVFYILQVMVPYSLFLYTWSLCEQTQKAEAVLFRILSVPAVLMGILVLTNVKTGLLFRVDRTGTYIKGPFYLWMYFYAFVYGLIVLLCSIWRYRKLGPKKLGIILEFLFILGGCVGIQALENGLLMTGFGLGLGILLLYLTLNNPSDHTDQLTGLFNSRSFRGRMQQLYGQKKGFHIIAVDLPKIRQINRLFGSRVGDGFLCRIGRGLGEILETEYIFRVSGKRFILISSSIDDYERVRGETMEFLNRTLEVEEERLQSSGIVCGIINAQELGDHDTLLSYIDYLVSLSPPSMETILVQSDENTRKGFLDKKEIERFLHTAIEEDLFEVCYQPVFSVKKGGFITLEALSRLRHPTLGPVPPDVFIGIAEQSGQIVQIGMLQFRRVCGFVKEHPELLEEIRNIKFNLSPAELLREGCSRDLIGTIREFDLPCSFFQFEITETVATEYSDRLYQVAEDFQACGIGLSLDDFGSGYANLDTVLKLSFSSIKLDRSLLHDIMEDEKARMFYRNIVALLKNMGYYVISEGVEHKKEVDLLLSWGVDMIQGYYFSKPLPPDELLNLLKIR